MFEIGNSLREARTRRSIDFNQAEQATKIRARYLRALEDERFEQLPSQTYVKGFLRTYADYLGLDGQLYVDEFNSRFATGDDHDARVRRSSVRPERRTRRLETGIVLVAVALVAIVTLVVTSAWQTSGSGSKAPKVSHRTQSHKKTTIPPPHAYLEIAAVAGPSYVTVHRGDATGRLLFQGTVSKGERRAVRRQELLGQRQLPREPAHHRRGQADRGRRLQAGRLHRELERRSRGVAALRAAIVVTGSELVRGDRTDLNGPFLARSLLELGVEPAELRVVGDVPDELEVGVAGGPPPRPARDLGRARPDPRRSHGRAARARGRARASGR